MHVALMKRAGNNKPEESRVFLPATPLVMKDDGFATTIYVHVSRLTTLHQMVCNHLGQLEYSTTQNGTLQIER
jgi:hypothetical protein